MRYVNNNRGAHPAPLGDDSTTRMWTFDDDNYDGSVCLQKTSTATNNILMRNSSAVEKVDTIVGRGRRTGSVRGYPDTDIDANMSAAIGAGNYVVGGWFRFRDLSGVRAVISMWAHSGTSSGYNNALYVKYDAGTLQYIYQRADTGGNVGYIDTGIELQEYEWYYLLFRAVESGGTMTFEVIINGVQAYEGTGLALPEDGSGNNLAIGVLYDDITRTTTEHTSDMDVAGVYFWESRTDEQIRDDVARGHLIHPDVRSHVDVQIEDQSASLVSMRSYYEEDWIESVSVTETNDSNTDTATVELLREIGHKSIAPLAENSFLNFTAGNPAVMDAFLKPRNEIEIFFAKQPTQTRLLVRTGCQSSTA